jgi:hypothetical protein
VRDDSFFIRGFAVAQWLAGEQNQAVGTFLSLVKGNKAWLKPQTLTQLNLAGGEMKALIDVQAEIFRRDPSLQHQQ